MWLLVHGSHYRLVYPQQQMLVMKSEDGEHYFLVPHGERRESRYSSLLHVTVWESMLTYVLVVSGGVSFSDEVDITTAGDEVCV